MNIKIEDLLKNILDQYKVERDFMSEIKNDYRSQIEDDLNSVYDVNPNYRYGGSLAKGTANTNSSDIDLLCYFDSKYAKTVENIFEETKMALEKKNYNVIIKNSAITVLGMKGGEKWNVSVDVVPGKYTSNHSNSDVYLWCNKDKCRLKSNPEIQIEKVKKSNCKEIIRLIKLYRFYNNFNFKSFYLEIFSIDKVSCDFTGDDSIYTKLVKFCKHYEDIGTIKIYDPANRDNDINAIHNSNEFNMIRNKIKNLYDALLTNDYDTIKNCVFGKKYDIKTGYFKNAQQHSHELSFPNAVVLYNNPINIKGFYHYNDSWKQIDACTKLEKDTELRFEISIPNSIQAKSIGLIVSNAGYEAMMDSCLRGGLEPVTLEKTQNINRLYVRTEVTKYTGIHFVCGLVKTANGGKFYSDILEVRIK